MMCVDIMFMHFSLYFQTEEDDWEDSEEDKLFIDEEWSGMESVEDYGGQPVGYMHDGGWGQAAAGGKTTFGSKLQELEDRYCGTPPKKRLKLKKKKKTHG